MEELRVSITADASGVGPGIAEATQQVTASAETIAAAQAKATAATKALAEAEQAAAAMGADLNATNSTAAGFLQSYREAAAQAQAELSALTSAENANTAANAANTASQERNTAATYNRMEAMGAARIGMGAMTGSVGAMEYGLARLAAGSASLGPILAGMVPVAVVAAGLFIVKDLVESIIAFAEKASDLAAETGAGWLDGAIGQLSGLAEVAKQAEAEIEKLDRDMDTLASRGQKADIENIRLTAGPAAAFRAEAAAKQAQAAHNQTMLNNLLRDQVELQKQAAEVQQSTILGVVGGEGNTAAGAGPTQAALKAAEQLKVVTKQIADYQATNTDLLKEAANLELQAAQVKGPKAAKEKAEKDPNAQAKRFEVEDAIADARRREQSAAEITAAIDAEGVRELREEEHERTVAADQVRRDAEEQKRNRAEQIEAAHQRAQAIIQAANLDYEATQQEIKEQESLGEISHRVAAQRLTDAVNLREKTIGGALGAEQGLFNPVLGAKEKLEYDRLQTQMTDEAKRAALQRQKIAEEEATQLERVYKRVADTFNRDFTTAFNSWATKSQTAGQAFGHMLGEMELQVVDFAAKTILEHFEMWAQIKLMNALGIETTQSQQAIANLKEVTADAKVAAANAYKWASAWGGPPAGAIAAGVAFTAVEAFGGGVFDAGGMMGHMTYALNTSGSPERVLSPSQTRNFETMVNQGGARTAHLNYAPTIHGDANEKMLQEHSNQMMGKLRSMLRPEAWQ